MAIDQPYADLTEQILRDPDRDDITVAMCMLREGGHERPVHWTCEYGDGEGISSVEEFAHDARPYLRPGESLVVRLLCVSPDFQCVQCVPLDSETNRAPS